MYDFEIPPSVTIEDDVFGPGTDWRTMTESDDDLGGTAFAVLAYQSLRAADALRSVKATFSFVGDDGQVYTEEEAEDLFDTYTPNYVYGVQHLPGVGASIVADTKGVLFPNMARTMLWLIVHALAVRNIQATIVHYVPASWSGAVAYTTATDENHSSLMRRVLVQHQEYERGTASGTVWAIQAVLEQRGLAVPEAVRQQVVACTDLRLLSIWLRRAVTATTAEEITRE